MKKAILWLILLLLAAALCVILFVPGPRFSEFLSAMQGLPALQELPQSQPEPKHVEIELIGESTVVVEYGEEYQDPGAKAWLVGEDGSREPLELEPSSVDTRRLGTSEVKYSVDVNGITAASVSRTIIVRDTTPPELTLLGEPGERDYTAIDNADGDLSDQVQRTEEDDRIVYTVRDSSGNETSAERKTDPVLEFVGGESVRIPADFRFFEPGVIARDMYGRDLTDRLQVEGEIIPWKLGDYELTYSLTDDFGRSVSAVRHIEVVKAELPETVLQDKVIYLTFDDGPAEATEALLDMLAKYDAKVTFFVTYSDPRYVDLIGRAYREGHSIGVHAYKHDASLIYAGEEEYIDYFGKMQEVIKEQTGEYSRIVRFVGGSSNSSSVLFCPGIMSTLAEDLTNMGYRYYDWNIQPEPDDENVDLDRSFVTLRYGSYEICGEGEEPPISLQHDTAGWAVFVVERMIQWGLENGYTFKGIDLTTPEVHHPIGN
ncbi:MAG: immunoglobulin-like domain-containing protein [Clostridia bacterium]